MALHMYPSTFPAAPIADAPGPRPGTRAYDHERAIASFPADAEANFYAAITATSKPGRRRRSSEEVRKGILWFTNPSRACPTAKDQSDRHWWTHTFRYCPVEKCLFALPTRKHSRERKLIVEEDLFKTIVYEHDIYGPRGHQNASSALMSRYYGPTRQETITLLKQCQSCGKGQENVPDMPDMFMPGLSTSLQQMSHGSVLLKGIPIFPSYAEKRNWQLNHLAAAFRYFNRRGYIEGISGHISVRDPEYTNAFWINPLGVHFGLLKASDMILLDMDSGMTIGGNRSRPASTVGYQIHKSIHLARGDVNAICFAHTIHGRAYSALGKPLEMLTQDACNFYKAHSVYANYGGAVLAGEESRNIVSALGRNKACILMNHGLLTVGSTVDEAAYLLGLMERCCQIQLLADAATAAPDGKGKKIIGEHEAAYNFKLTSDPERLYADFQPDYDYEEATSHGDFKQFETPMFLN